MTFGWHIRKSKNRFRHVQQSRCQAERSRCQAERSRSLLNTPQCHIERESVLLEYTLNMTTAGTLT